jgi:hypothetical protein
MSIDPDDEVAEILKPVDDLLAREATEMKEAEARIAAEEQKLEKLFPPAKRDDEA